MWYRHRVLLPIRFPSAEVQIYAAEACLLVAIAQTLMIIKIQIHP